MKKIWAITDAVASIVRELSELPGIPKDRNSGYFTLIRREDGRLITMTQIGECPPEKVERYFHLSREKAHRLLEKKGHISSWQSRNVHKGLYGGAIAAGGFIFSFSGLPEQADEAAMLKTAVACFFMNNTEAWRIAAISENDFFRP